MLMLGRVQSLVRVVVLTFNHEEKKRRQLCACHDKRIQGKGSSPDSWATVELTSIWRLQGSWKLDAH